MKHNYFLYISIFLISFSSKTQLNIELRETSGGATVNGDTLIIYGSPSDNDLHKTIYTKNTDTDTIEINIKRYEIGVTTGTKNTFCWGVCPTEQAAGNYPVWSNPVSITMNPSQELSNMQAKFFPRTKATIDTFLFVWYNVAVPTDSAYLTLIFNTASASINNSQENINLSVFPNPSSDFIALKGDIDYSSIIEIFDAIGKPIKRLTYKDISNNKKIDISNLKKGIHFVRLTNNQGILTRKIMIK